MSLITRNVFRTIIQVSYKLFWLTYVFTSSKSIFENCFVTTCYNENSCYFCRNSRVFRKEDSYFNAVSYKTYSLNAINPLKVSNNLTWLIGIMIEYHWHFRRYLLFLRKLPTAYFLYSKGTDNIILGKGYENLKFY